MRASCISLLIPVSSSLFSTASCFTSLMSGQSSTATRRSCHILHASNNNKDVDPFTKAFWFSVEAFGNAFGSKEKSKAITISRDQPPSSPKETLQRLQDDNQRQYFLSGEIDELIYDDECVFTDPFVSFKGRQRFVDNLANLGSFITEYSAKPLDYTVTDTVVTTKFMVKLQLNLPWKPVLAWPWGVRCEIDPKTNLIVLHEESWDIEPLQGVKQIFRKPATTVR
jgi:hypothetical protein